MNELAILYVGVGLYMAVWAYRDFKREMVDDVPPNRLTAFALFAAVIFGVGWPAFSLFIIGLGCWRASR